MPKLPSTLQRSAIVKAIRAEDQGPEVVEYDQYVTDHIRSTGQAVQASDIAYSVATLAAGWLGFLLAAAIAEHWLTAQGFSHLVRFLLFGGATVATIWYVWTRLWPLVTNRINPLYTARSIEQSAPSLKNSLINLLTLREDKRQLPPAVLATLQQQAAEGIVRAPEEAVVDRSRVVRMAGVVVALLAVMMAYWVFSVKNPFTTAARIAAPWANIAPPSRVRIEDVTPGTTTLIEGQPLDIEARITGLAEEEPAEVVITSADGQYVNHRVRLEYDQGLERYRTVIPTLASQQGEAGLSGKSQYRLEAGDGQSIEYELTVLPAPAIVVDSVGYEFPAYTALLDYEDQESADLRAIEGTRVTLRATANSPIQSAHVDFENDGSHDLAMTVEGNTATASFELSLREDRQTPKHRSYALRFKTAEGLANSRPAKHGIEVYPDYAPEVELLLPEEEERTVRLNETVVIRTEARDPDFRLADLRLYGERDGQRVMNKRLLKLPARGKQTQEYRFVPSTHGLQAGDVLEYWVEATDNRRPGPQTTATLRKRFKIASPDARGNTGQQEMADADGGGEPSKDNPGQEGESGGKGEKSGNNAGGNTGQSQDDASDDAQGGGGTSGEPSDAQPSEGDQNAQGGAGQSSQQPGESQQSPTGNNGEAGESGESGDKQQGSADENPDGGNDSTGEQNDSQEGQKNGSGGSQQGNPDGQGGDQTGEDPADQKQGGQNQSGGDNNQPVDPSGADDGQAFEKMLDHLQQQEQEGQQQGNQSQQDHPGEGGQNDKSAEGRGADSTGGDMSDNANGQDKNQQQSDQQQSDKSPGGEQKTPKGDPSASGAKGEPQGSPAGADNTKPTDKPSRDPGQQNEKKQESAAPSKGRKESDSMSDQSGDRPGGGDEGGGQRTPREGTGSSGENQSAEEGGGKSADRGAGETNQKAGGDKPSQQPTGQPGEDQPGEGSAQRDGKGDQQGGDSANPNGNPGTNPAGDPNDPQGKEQEETGKPKDSPDGNQQKPSDKTKSPNEKSPNEQSKQSAPGDQQPGEPGQSDQGEPTDNNDRPMRSPESGANAGNDYGADEANVDFARKKTDLVLERLSDQLKKNEVDETLLKKLGWSEADLRQFVKRWKTRKTAAQRPGAKEGKKVELDNALRRLGLKPSGARRETQRNADQLRNQASGSSRKTPAKFREKLRRYNQGVSGAGGN